LKGRIIRKGGGKKLEVPEGRLGRRGVRAGESLKQILLW